MRFDVLFIRSRSSEAQYCSSCGRPLESDYERRVGVCLKCMSPIIERCEEG